MQNTILIHAPGRRQGRGALVLAYTALFALLMGIWAAIFALNGQSFIQYGDTLKQHYPFLVYYGRWLRQAARCVLTGAAVLTWDFSIGYGADIITTLSYYGLGDPLDLLAAFVPGRWTEQLLEGLIVLRLYLAGLAFMAFSRRHGNSRFGTLLGALAYVFSAWPIQAGLIEPVFLVPMYCFPLMLLGADDLFEGRSPVLYIAAIALTALSNFLFFSFIWLQCYWCCTPLRCIASGTGPKTCAPCRRCWQSSSGLRWWALQFQPSPCCPPRRSCSAALALA